VGGDPRQQTGLGRMIRKEELDLAEAIPLPPAEPDKEGDRSRGRREGCEYG